MASGTKEMTRFKKILNKVGGDEMFVYKLPTGDISGDVWKFHEYEKYEKIYADIEKGEEITKDITKERRLLEDLPPRTTEAVHTENDIDNDQKNAINGEHIEEKTDFETTDIKGKFYRWTFSLFRHKRS